MKNPSFLRTRSTKEIKNQKCFRPQKAYAPPLWVQAGAPKIAGCLLVGFLKKMKENE
jgi:hypothetical protein